MNEKALYIKKLKFLRDNSKFLAKDILEKNVSEIKKKENSCYKHVRGIWQNSPCG